MIRRAFFVVLAALALSSLTIQAGSAPARARLGMVITQSDIASADWLRGHQGRRQRD